MSNPIEEFLSEVPDPRTGRNVQYPLQEILLVVDVPLLTGGAGYDDMAGTGRAKRGLLKLFYPFVKGIPCEGTFRHVFMSPEPKRFGEYFAQWMRYLYGRPYRRVGGDRQKALPWQRQRQGSEPLEHRQRLCREYGIVLAALDATDKSNEITVLPDLLRLLGLKGSVVALDAMGCQKGDRLADYRPEGRLPDFARRQSRQLAPRSGCFFFAPPSKPIQTLRSPTFSLRFLKTR